jgi:hypothetical protein
MVSSLVVAAARRAIKIKGQLRRAVFDQRIKLSACFVRPTTIALS